MTKKPKLAACVVVALAATPATPALAQAGAAQQTAQADARATEQTTQSSAPGNAQDAFYAGRTVTIVTSTGEGGTYDLIARTVARFMPRHLPGSPTMIVQNMPGGGNVLATNFMHNVAPKDGTTLAVINNSIPMHQVLNGKGVRYDTRNFHWLGSTGARNSVTIVAAATGVRTIEDAKKTEVIAGGTGAGSALVIFPTVMNNLLGTRFKIVKGYKSSADVFLAIERGEVQARAGGFQSILSEYPDWISSGKVNVIVQIGPKRDAQLPDVPLLHELGEGEEQRRILRLISSQVSLGQPYLLPPGVPEARVAAMRQAFQATLRDAGFLAEAAKRSFEIYPMSAEEVTAIVHETVNVSPAVIAAAKKAMATE